MQALVKKFRSNNKFGDKITGCFAMHSNDVASVPPRGPMCRAAASLPSLVLPLCLGLSGCDGEVSTKPLSAGLGDTIIHVGNGGHEAWLIGRSEDIGYKFSSVSFMYIDLWTWGGTYCVYQRFEHTYSPISVATAARLLKKEKSDLKTPFWYRFPRGWFIFGPLFFLAAICSTIRNLRKRKTPPLDGPPRKIELPSL